MTLKKKSQAKPNQLRREISIALILKIVLLIGLWFLIFRWFPQPGEKASIAEHFNLPISEQYLHIISKLPQQEVHHVW